MATMEVEVVTPERVIYSGESTMVVTRTLSGEVAFLPHHAPFLGALVENHTRVYVEGERVEDIAVLGGFVEVSNNRVTILAERAELAEEIDVEHVRRALEDAEHRAINDDDPEVLAEIRRNQARLSVAGG
jgi:F-type H+-transporting ATPase subunit epsilon